MFRGRTLAISPWRHGKLSLLYVGATVILYISAAYLAQSVVNAKHPEIGRKIHETALPQAGTQGRSPTTTSVPATKPAATATTSTPVVEADTAYQIDSNIGQWISGLCTAAFIMVLASRTMIGGIAAFGMRLARLPMGIVLGVFAAILLAPWIGLVGIITQLVSNMMNSGPAPVHPVFELAKTNLDPGLRLVLLSTGILVAPFLEEIMFRGLLQTTLLHTFRRFEMQGVHESVFLKQEALNRWGSILITSAIFAAVHISLEGWQAMPELFLLAVTLGYLYERSGNLWACMTLHACFNAVGFYFFFQSGQ